MQSAQCRADSQSVNESDRGAGGGAGCEEGLAADMLGLWSRQAKRLVRTWRVEGASGSAPGGVNGHRRFTSRVRTDCGGGMFEATSQGVLWSAS